MSLKLRDYQWDKDGFIFKWWPYIGHGKEIVVYRDGDPTPYYTIRVWDYAHDCTSIVGYLSFIMACQAFLKEARLPES
ncbi:hypothetical protein [Glycomyces sp. NPDC048151]|uniref:hypothetical protein n=1 Tax=Glycomyces sp. NPDC048151 TaxID=3364002 RepID=UPI003718B2D9